MGGASPAQTGAGMASRTAAAEIMRAARYETAAKLDPEIIISDISMPKMSGIEAVRRLVKAGSTAKIIFLTVHEDSDFVPACFEVGGLAYVVKSRIASDLLPAIRMVQTNHTFVSPTVPWQPTA